MATSSTICCWQCFLWKLLSPNHRKCTFLPKILISHPIRSSQLKIFFELWLFYVRWPWLFVNFVTTKYFACPVSLVVVRLISTGEKGEAKTWPQTTKRTPLPILLRCHCIGRFSYPEIKLTLLSSTPNTSAETRRKVHFTQILLLLNGIFSVKNNRWMLIVSHCVFRKGCQKGSHSRDHAHCKTNLASE